MVADIASAGSAQPAVGVFSQHVAGLNRSFAAIYALLERPRAAQRAVVALLAVHTGLLAYSAYVHSPTLNEPGHLVAGLSIWKFGRFDVYSVNPPLVKMVAALPVIAAGYEEDWSGFYTGPGARPEFAMGENFVAANGERSFFLFMIARWACIPFSWLGAIVCYLWARDLFGRPSGVVACAIWCFEPNILAHASLITPDAHAAALGIAACYTFWRWLKYPTWTQAALTGVVLGLAELTKTTLILFYPLWPLMWAVYRWADRQSMLAKDWLREAGMLAVRMLIGLYVLNLGYGFEGSLKPLSEFHFVSDLFTGTTKAGDRRLETGGANAPFPGREGLGEGSEGSPSHNRFTNTWLASMPVPFPANYFVGIDLQQKDFEHYGRPSYLRGEWRDHGWWYYYLYAAAIKVPLGLWALGVGALIGVLIPLVRRERQGEKYSSFRSTANVHQSSASFAGDLFILLFPPLVIFVVVSSKTGFNEHFRYVLPCFPFVFIAISSAFRVFLDNAESGEIPFTQFIRCNIQGLAAPRSLALLIWSFASSLLIYPHSMSYFTEAIGGPRNGPDHLLGSNVDWGQDLRYVSQLISEHSLSPVSPAFYVDSTRKGAIGKWLIAIPLAEYLRAPQAINSAIFVSVNAAKDPSFRRFERHQRTVSTAKQWRTAQHTTSICYSTDFLLINVTSPTTFP